MTRDYHHGDLPAALRAAAVDLIAEVGPNGFSLREVARRAGVSHAAPAHHFGDTKGLLTSVAAEGYRTLSQAMADGTAHATNARERLAACGRSYVTVALANPGHYGVMIGDIVDETDEEFLIASIGAYEQLLETVHSLRDEYNPDLDVDATATLCWAAVHGLVELVPVLEQVASATGTQQNTIDYLIDHLTEMTIEGIKDNP
jgi:AcrR family transcriptional regulator